MPRTINKDYFWTIVRVRVTGFRFSLAEDGSHYIVCAKLPWQGLNTFFVD